MHGISHYQVKIQLPSLLFLDDVFSGLGSLVKVLLKTGERLDYRSCRCSSTSGKERQFVKGRGRLRKGLRLIAYSVAPLFEPSSKTPRGIDTMT